MITWRFTKTYSMSRCQT